MFRNRESKNLRPGRDEGMLRGSTHLWTCATDGSTEPDARAPSGARCTSLDTLITGATRALVLAEAFKERLGGGANLTHGPGALSVGGAPSLVAVAKRRVLVFAGITVVRHHSTRFQTRQGTFG